MGVDEAWTPSLNLSEYAGRCRLSLGGCVIGTGATLQEAADDLIAKLLAAARHVRAGGVIPRSTELRGPDARVMSLLHELGRIDEQGGDIRARVFGPLADAA